MKTRIINSLKKKVLLVDGLPDNLLTAIDVVGNKSGKWLRTLTTEGAWFNSDKLPEGNWEFLSTLKDITEGLCEDLMPLEPISKESKFYGYPIFARVGAYVNKAKHSLLSALESEGVLFENPYPKYYKDANGTGYAPFQREKYAKAEENVFSPSTLIFIES